MQADSVAGAAARRGFEASLSAMRLQPPGLPTLIGVLDLVQQGVIIDFKTSSTTPKNSGRFAHPR